MLLATFALSSWALAADHATPSVNPDEALNRLKAGNERFARTKVSAGKPVAARRIATAKAQHPFAIIVACADSRTSPEIVFDQNIGDLFVVRTAGNLVDDYALGSIEYAVEHLGSRLIVVLGHERCGAQPLPIKALPPWLRAPVAEQSLWKWIAFFLLLGCFALLLRPVPRLSRRGGDERPLRQALLRLSLPLFFLLATPVVTYLALAQINLIGGVASVIELAAAAIMFLAGAWIVWRIAPVLAEALIATPKINTESIDAHLIRICTRLLGIVAAAALLAVGASRLGLPVYGIVAGLGVGGLAIALAAQPTMENLIGGLSLFADKPIRVGDVCRYGSDEGTVEAIGIRSTRIRGRDRTLTTMPNAVLSKMPLVSLSQRDQMLIQSVIGVRYETSPDQLRYLLVRIREALLSHPKIQTDSVRIRFVDFGASSLDIELFAYVKTTNRAEFLSVREELFLRVMDIVNESGTGFAFPSQTLYFGRDSGLDPKKTEKAEAQMRQWQDKGHLPVAGSLSEQPSEIAVDPPPDSQSGPTQD